MSLSSIKISQLPVYAQSAPSSAVFVTNIDGKTYQIPASNIHIESSEQISINSLVQSNSSTWDSVYSYVNANSGIEYNQEAVVTFVLNNSSNIISVDTLVNNSSANWNAVYSYVNTTSSTGYDQTFLLNNSANILLVDTLVNNTSANWNQAYDIGTVYENTSSFYASVGFVDGNFFPISGGTITGFTTLLSSIIINGNVTIGKTVSANNFYGNGSGLNPAGALLTGGTYNAGIFSTAASLIGGSNNFFVGSGAGYSNTTGYYNNFLGFGAGAFNTTGSSNNFLGISAGCSNTTGSNNTIIGNTSDTATGNLSGVIVLGTGATATESYQLVLSTANVSIKSSLSTLNIGSPTVPNNLTVFGTISASSYLGISISGINVPSALLTGGTYNAGIFSTAASLIGGSNNFFVGSCAGACNTIGSSNNFLGYSAGYSNTTGYSNNFLGSGAGYSNTTGYSNNFVGYGAGYSNTTGGSNSFLGSGAGRSNATGNSNNFLGSCAGYSNTTGYSNNFFGSCAGYSNTTGSSNNFLGSGAGACNTTGDSNNFFGSSAGACNTIGYSNNFLGYGAGLFNTVGSSNNFLGYCAGRCNTVGSSNNFLGYCAGNINVSGSNNTIIGTRADTATSNLSGVIVLGTGATATESYQLVLSTANVSIQSTASTLNIGSPTVPNNLTVFGKISSNSVVYANGGNSDSWNTTFTTVATTSATWGSGGVSVVPLSGVDSGTTITINAASSKNWYFTLYGNRTLSFAGLTAGISGSMFVTQDSSGSHSLAVPVVGTSKTPGGGGILLSSAPNAIDTVSFYYDGSVIFLTSGPKGWA